MSKEFKKVLILAYFFKPNSLTASGRPYFWAKYLHKFGYYPIVVTRTWGDGKISNPKDIFLKGHKEISKIEKNDNYEVHYVTYHQNLRDRLYVKKGSSLFVRALTFIAIFTKGISNYFNEGKEIYQYTKGLIKSEGVSKLVITANPYVMFKYGYLLKKEFGIQWVADYRDDWTTSELTDNRGVLFRLLNRVDQVLEKKWVKSSSLITSVSDYYVCKIKSFIQVEGQVLYNGFEFFHDDNVVPDSDAFNLCFNGTLYQTQNVEMLIEGIKLFIDDYPNVPLKMSFPGLAYSKDQEKRVKSLIWGYEKYFWISDRITKDQVIEIQKKSHLLLMLNHKNLKGIPSSKLYEYLSLKRNILVVGGDDDIVDNTILTSEVGVVSNSANEVKNNLIKYWSHFRENPSSVVINHSKSEIYLIENSIKSLASYIDDLG